MQKSVKILGVAYSFFSILLLLKFKKKKFVFVNQSFWTYLYFKNNNINIIDI